MNNKRTSLYEALTSPKTATDYGVTMPVTDFMDEAEARGDSHPWLPTKDELAMARRLSGAIQTIARESAKAQDRLMLRCISPTRN